MWHGFVGLVAIVTVGLLAAYVSAVVTDRLLAPWQADAALRDVLRFGVVISVFLLTIVVVVRSVREPRDLVIGTITVPRSIERAGLSSSVVAQSLRAAIIEVIKAAETSVAPQRVSLGGEALREGRVSIKEIEFSPMVLLDWLQDWLGSADRREVTGDLYYDDDGRLHLVLWYNGATIIRLPDQRTNLQSRGASYRVCLSVTAPSDLADLLQEGAFRLLDMIDPYFVAAACYRTAPGPALQLVDRIIATRSGNAEVLSHAYNLQGLLHLKMVQCQPPELSFQNAIDTDSHFILPYLNWADWLIVNRHYQEGLNKGREGRDSSISLTDPVGVRIATAYDEVDAAAIEINLADELSIVLTSDPQAANIGAQELADAQALYQRAARTARHAITQDPQEVSTYGDLGDALFGQAMLAKHQGKDTEEDRLLAEARAAYRGAVELRPQFFAAHAGLFVAAAHVAWRTDRPRNGTAFDQAVKDARKEWSWLHLHDRFTRDYTVPEGDYARAMNILRKLDVPGYDWSEPEVVDRPDCEAFEP